MSLIKKIALICICFNVVFLSTKCGEPDLPIMDDEVIPENYYGDVLGYAKEVGDVEVVTGSITTKTFGDYYCVVDFSSTSKQNRILIIPDCIDGKPVLDVGLSDDGQFDNQYYILPNGDTVYGLHEYSLEKVPLTDPDTGEEVKDKNGNTKYKIEKKFTLYTFNGTKKNYLFYLDYPQFDHTGTLDSLYISSFQISNYLPILFLDFSDEGKIIFNTSLYSQYWKVVRSESGEYVDQNYSLKVNDRLRLFDILNIRNDTFVYFNAPHEFESLLNLIYSEYTDYSYEHDFFKKELIGSMPKFVFSKAKYFCIEYYTDCVKYTLQKCVERGEESSNLYNRYDLLLKSLNDLLTYCEPANVSFKYNLNIEGQPYTNYKYPNNGVENTNNMFYLLNESENYPINYVTYFMDGHIYYENDYEKYCDLSDFLNLVELDEYWIDYNEDGDLLMEPPAPYVEGYEFLGWYKDSECTEEWNFETDRVHFEDGCEELVLYAKWK